MDVTLQTWLVPLLLWVAALAFAGVAIAREPGPIRRDFVIDRLLRYLFLLPLGVLSLWAFVGHVFFPEQSAAAIGWTPSPFQYEVGVANLGLGLASVCAAFSSFRARVAVLIVAMSFLAGAGIGHIREIVQTGNFAPGNAGPILFTDFLTPIVILVLLLLAAQSSRPKSPASIALEAELEVARKALKNYRQALDNFGRE
jgi:hypothetical protein